MAKAKYSESSIERYAGLSGIRKKSSVYIGPNDSNGLWTIWREPCDNFVDRALAGDNKVGHLVVDPKENVYWVRDEGPGIPVGVREFEDEHGRKEKWSTLYVVTGLTHGGSNFKGDTISRGTHGIGIKATNAMSKSMTVWTYRDRAWWCIEYRDAKLHKKPYKTKAPKMPHGIRPKLGTVVRFEPDMKLFSKSAKMRREDVQEWSQLTSYLVPGLKVMYTNAKGKTTTTVSKRGVLDFIDARLAELGCAQVNKKVFVLNTQQVDVALTFTDAQGNNLVSAYTNGLQNREGGTHVDAVHEALFKSLKPCMGKLKYTPTDLKDGLIGLVNAKLAAPKFNNQRKDKLDDERPIEEIVKQTLTALEKFWKANPSLAKTIVKRASDLRSKTNDFLKDKKLLTQVKNAKNSLPKKLKGCIGNVRWEDRELILVEGDSAGGGLSKVRDKQRQAVLCLKGKPLNVMDAPKDQINKNEEVLGILAAMGVGEPSKAKRKKVKEWLYGRVMICSDADVDGAHIRALLGALFHKYTPEYISEGRVYVIDLPEYVARSKNKTVYGMSREKVAAKAGKGAFVSHFKGLGEMEDDDLENTVTNMKTRKVTQWKLSSAEGQRKFEALMGKDTSYRKEVLGINKVDAGRQRKEKK